MQGKDIKSDIKKKIFSNNNKCVITEKALNIISDLSENDQNELLNKCKDINIINLYYLSKLTNIPETETDYFDDVTSIQEKIEDNDDEIEDIYVEELSSLLKKYQDLYYFPNNTQSEGPGIDNVFYINRDLNEFLKEINYIPEFNIFEDTDTLIYELMEEICNE